VPSKQLYRANRLDSDRMAVLSQIGNLVHATRLPIFLWSFEPDSIKYLTSVKWRAAIWQSDKGVSHRDETSIGSCSNQYKRRTSDSTQFNKSSRKARVYASEMQPGSYYVISCRINVLLAESCRWQKTRGLIQTTCNGAIQWRNICERNISV